MTKMTKEDKFVVQPLKGYFSSRKRSKANWVIKDEPTHTTSETGWDLQVEHKNKVLLIEAKYIRGPFAPAFAGLTIAPLVYRPEKMKNINLYRSKYFAVCWAIGCGYHGGKRNLKYKMSGVFQILFDGFILNLDFWKQYSKFCRLEHIFFVDNKKVAQIRFDHMIDLATKYKTRLDEIIRNQGGISEITEIHRRRRIKIKIRRLEAERSTRHFKFL